MSSLSASTLAGNQRPRLHVAPPWTETNGDLATYLAGRYGLVPDAWQQLLINDWLAEVDGRYAALTCGAAVPRQNGKNGVIEIRELFGMVGRGERILHTAHEVKTARKAFKRLQHFFGTQKNDPGAKFPELNALVTELRNVNGQEAILLTNGGSVEIVARSKNSGRGFTADVLVMDEAQEMSDEDLEALMPTTSAAPLGNPQWIFTGTPPGPKAAGEVFTRTRTDAISGHAHRTAWGEWSAAGDSVEDIDLDDRDLWWANNPALGGRLQLEVVQGERSRFSSEGFARERLGWWKPGGQGGGAFDLSAWAALTDSSAPRGASPTFAVATPPDRSWAAVGVAWSRPDGGVQVSVADYRRTTTWVEARVAELRARWGGRVLTDTASDGLVPDAVRLSQADQAKAHNALSDRVEAGSVHHYGDAERELAVSVDAARWKPAGDSRVLDRKGSTDISPLVAVALAAHGLATAPTTGGWMVGV